MGKTNSILNKPVTLGFLAFAIMAALFTILIYQRFLIVKETKKKEAYDIVNTAKDKLQEALAYGSSATKILSFFIDNNGVVRNFDSVSAEIMNTNKDIDVLELVPGGVIRYVYPLQGNEAVLGYDILKDSTRSKEALKAIEKKELFFSGPYALKQGSLGIVGRLPIFRNRKFWGFSAVVIKLSTLLKAAGIDSADKDGNYFQLSKINPDTKKEEFFIPYQKEQPQDYTVSVNIPDGEWKLSLKQTSGYKGFADIFILALLGFVISVLGGIFVFNQAGKPKRLDELVKERTRQLKESDERFSKAFHSNVVGFAIYDSDFRIIDINQPYAHILESSREKLIGKTSDEAGLISKISSERREMISKEIEVILNTEGQLQNFETEIITNDGEAANILLSIEPLELNNKPYWLTSVIDITANKKAELLMIESEEKYRTLIEQASDGIIITTLDGHIIEVNKSVCLMSGYDEQEMLGEHLYKFLPAEDVVENPLRFKELMEGKSLLYERRLLKKDGTILDIEVNSKMASSHTMIGFFRDISERKKNEETLRYQARLLDSVSDAVTSVDMNRRIVSWNKACEELYGFKPEDALGKRIPELVTFEFPGTTTEEVFKQVYSEGRWKGEFNFMHPQTNSKIYLLSSINILKNKDENITGLIITSRDISDRKMAEEEIRKSSERFELIAQATNDAVWDHDFDRNETWGNKKLYDLYGFEQGSTKINFEMFLDQIHPDEKSKIEERMKLAIANSETFLSEEFRFKTAAGKYRNFYDRAYIKYDDGGKPLRILGAMEDITDREEIRKQIIKEKELGDSIINSLPGVFYLYNRQGKFLRWNKNFESVTGYSAEEISHMHPLDFFTEEQKELLTQKIANVFVAGTDNVEANFYLKNKQKVPYYFTGEAIEYEGEICLMGVGLDFSEREKAASIIRESEEKYRTLVEQASDGIFIADKNGRFLVVNSSGYNMSQYSEEELKNMNIYDLVLPEDIKKDPFHFSEMQGGMVARAERRMKRKDGKLVDVEVTARFISGERFLAFVRDVSERKQADRALRESEEKYRTMIEQASDGIFIADKNAYFIDVNSAGCRMLGYTKEELYKIRFQELIPPADFENNPIQFSKLDEGVTVINERRLLKKDGSAIEVEISAKLLFDGRYQSIVRDITQRKKADKALRESEERYRALVENAPEALVVFDVEKRGFVSVSESATKLFGMSKEELLKIGPVELSPEYQPDGRPSAEVAAENIGKAINGEKPSFEWTHCDKDGKLIPCQIWLVRLPSENAVLIRGSIVDITERKKAEEEILRSREQFQNLVENISGVYWVNDLETYQTLYISPSYENIWGRVCEDLYKNPADFINSVHPEDKKVLEEAHRNVSNTFKNSLSYRIIRPDGEIRWISANTNVVKDTKGDKIEYGYAEDITERRKSLEELHLSEQKYRLLFYNNPSPMWMTTIPGLDIIDVNDAAIMQYGYTREEFLKLNTRDLRPKEDVENFLREVDKMSPGVINVRAWRHKKKDGTIIHVETYSHQIKYEGRQVWLGLSHDVTGNYNAKELLQRSYEEIRQLASNLQSIREDERTNIAREIHDELGQQLTGLKMDIHWLSRKIKNEDDEIRDKIKESIELINATITSVRKIATDLRPSILDDLGLMAALEWQGEEFEKRSGTKVKFINKTDELIVRPEVATAIFRIYQELLTNIARHANAGLVTASLDIEEDTLRFSIKDDGVGFNADTIGSKKTLGLLGIKERTLLMGGTYDIKTEPGKGSETIISIPIQLTKVTG